MFCRNDIRGGRLRRPRYENHNPSYLVPIPSLIPPTVSRFATCTRTVRVLAGFPRDLVPSQPSDSATLRYQLQNTDNHRRRMRHQDAARMSQAQTPRNSALTGHLRPGRSEMEFASAQMPCCESDMVRRFRAWRIFAIWDDLTAQRFRAFSH